MPEADGCQPQAAEHTASITCRPVRRCNEVAGLNSVARRPALPTAPIEVSFASAIYRAWRHPSRNVIDGERVVCRKRIAPNHEATEKFLADFSKLRVIMPCTCHSTTYAAAMPSRS